MNIARAVLVVLALYCVWAVVLTDPALDRMVGPNAEPVLQRFHGADFGGFYTGATAAARGQLDEFTDPDFQKQLQAEIQEREATGWRWFNPLPHPPVLSLFTMPISAFPIRTGYWVWVGLSFLAAGLAAWITGRALCAALIVPLIVLMLTFEPLWHLVQWGQVDAFILLPFATGFAWLIASRSDRDDLKAGALIGAVALVPQYALLPFLTLLVARRWAALGMALTGGTLAVVTMALIRIDGLRGYIEFYRSYGRPGNKSTVSEHAMFNIRGTIYRINERLDFGLSLTQFTVAVAVVSLAFAALTVVVAGRAFARDRAPDLAAAMLVIATVVTAYHTHRQTLVFFLIPMAVLLRRAYRSRNAWSAVLWLAPVLGFHAATAILRTRYRLADYPIQTYLAPVCIAAIVLFALLLVLRMRATPRAVAVEPAP